MVLPLTYASTDWVTLCTRSAALSAALSCCADAARDISPAKAITHAPIHTCRLLFRPASDRASMAFRPRPNGLIRVFQATVPPIRGANEQVACHRGFSLAAFNGRRESRVPASTHKNRLRFLETGGPCVARNPH